MKLNTHGDVLVPHPVLQVWSETSAKALSKALSEISAQQAQRDLSDDLLEGAMAIARQHGAPPGLSLGWSEAK